VISTPNGRFFYTESSTDDIDTTEHEGLIVDQYNRTDVSAPSLVEAIEKADKYRTQVAYPVPEDEEQRLAALDDVDEHEFREYLDRLTTLSAQTFDAEYATVGLVEEHEQRLLSCHGTDVDSVARGDTICTYTIMAGGVMTVEDTTTDPRFENNEILAGLDIRSYAGAPLIAPSGVVIGTVCVFDTKPRTFTEEEREQLRRFADITLDQLEMR
jgi:GAF domain-containing protein